MLNTERVRALRDLGNKALLQLRETLLARNYLGLLLYLLAAMVLTISIYPWISRALHLKAEVKLDLGSITNIFGFVAAALVVALSHRKASRESREATRQQMYQTLELESVRLFRFEIEHAELAGIVWDDTKSYEELCQAENASLHYQTLQHICQVLNLFEMAVRFRKDEIVHPDVFGSWVIWIYNLCESEVFLMFWIHADLVENYIPVFQEIVRAGLDAAHTKTRVDKEFEKKGQRQDGKGYRDFRKYMVAKFACAEIGSPNHCTDHKST